MDLSSFSFLKRASRLDLKPTRTKCLACMQQVNCRKRFTVLAKGTCELVFQHPVNTYMHYA